MRKLFVMTLVLILALAGAAFAAELSWSGEFKTDGKWESGAVVPENSKFFGTFSMESSANVRFTLKDEDEVWDASIDLGGKFGEAPKLGRYIVKISDGAYAGTIWGNYGTGNIGHINDPFVFIRMSGVNNNAAPAVRVVGDFDQFKLTAQVPAAGNQFALNGTTTAGDVSLGGILEHNFETAVGAEDAYNRVTVYGGLEVGIVDLDAAVALTTEYDDKNSALGLGASADVTEKLNLSGEFRTVGENYGGHNSGIDLGATYTDGLLRVKGNHDINTDNDTSESSVGVIFRGSADNEPFNDLFKADHYMDNVAFAFGGTLTVGNAPGEAATTIALNATGPVLPDTFWFNSNLTTSQNSDGFAHGDYDSVRSYTGVTLDGYALMTEKLTLEPHVASKQWADVVHESRRGSAASLTLEVSATFAVTDDVSLRGKIGQTSTGGTDDFNDPKLNRFSSFGVTVKF